MSITKKTMKVCHEFLNKEMIEVQGKQYDADDVLKFALGYDARVSNVHDAVSLIKHLNLFQELYRVCHGDNAAYNYINKAPQELRYQKNQMLQNKKEI